MDAAAFEQVYESFRGFHAYFAPLFGRRETREHSGHYLQALLVQSGKMQPPADGQLHLPGFRNLAVYLQNRTLRRRWTQMAGGGYHWPVAPWPANDVLET